MFQDRLIPDQETQHLQAMRQQCHLLAIGRHLGVKRATVVGHSLGGFMALKMAIDFPEKVGPLVIVDSLPALGAAQMPDVTPEQMKDMARRMREGMLAGDASAQEASRRTTIASMVTAPQDIERVVEWSAKSDRKVGPALVIPEERHMRAWRNWQTHWI